MFEILLPLFTLAALLFLPFTVGAFFLPAYLSYSIRWYFGLGACGLFVLLAHSLNAPQILVWSFLIPVLCIAAIFVFSKKKLFTDDCEIDCPSVLLIQLSAWIALTFVVLSHPLTPYFWDALYIWYNKARALFYWNDLSEIPSKNLFMVNYPHLGPVLQMMLMKLSGQPIEEYGRLLFPAVYIAWSLSALNWVRRINFHHGYHLLSIIVLWAYFRQTHFINGYQDGFLSLTAGMATLCFLNSMIMEQTRQKTTSYFYLGVYFAGMCCFIKTEGFALGAIILIAFTVVSFFRKRGFSLVHFLYGWALFAAFVLCWPLLLSLHHIDPAKLQADAFSLKELPLLPYNLIGRWPVILTYYVEYFIFFKLQFFSVVLLSIWGFLRQPKIRSQICFLWLIALAHMVFVAIPFIMTHLPLEWHLSTAFGRLMFQHLFIYPLVILLCGSGIIQKLAQSR